MFIVSVEAFLTAEIALQTPLRELTAAPLHEPTPTVSLRPRISAFGLDFRPFWPQAASFLPTVFISLSDVDKTLFRLRQTELQKLLISSLIHSYQVFCQVLRYLSSYIACHNQHQFTLNTYTHEFLNNRAERFQRLRMDPGYIRNRQHSNRLES